MQLNDKTNDSDDEQEVAIVSTMAPERASEKDVVLALCETAQPNAMFAMGAEKRRRAP